MYFDVVTIKLIYTFVKFINTYAYTECTLSYVKLYFKMLIFKKKVHCFIGMCACSVASDSLLPHGL